MIMTAPGSILLSKILVPETETPETLGTVHAAEAATDANVLDAAARGTRDGLHLALNIAAMLISFSAWSRSSTWAWVLSALSLQGILGWAMAPVAYLLGVPWQDCRAVGELLGTRTVLNELIAYKRPGRAQEPRILIDRSVVIASFALCGFANISSIGIQLGGIGALVPERRHDLARLGLRALLRRHAGQLPLGLHRGRSSYETPELSSSPCARTSHARRPSRRRDPCLGVAEVPRIAVVLGLGTERAGRPDRGRHDDPLRPNPSLSRNQRRRA